MFPTQLLLISAAASVPHQDQKLRTGHKIRPVTTKETIVVGGRVPAADVELESVPADWGPSLTKYRYVYSGDRVMLVDPGSRTVVQEVD